MITNLIAFLYVLFLLFSIGFLVKTLLNRFSFVNHDSFIKPPLDHLILLGFISLTAILGFISLFSKIGLVVHLLVFGITFLGVILMRDDFFNLISFYVSELSRNRKILTYLLVLWPFLFLLIIYSANSIVIYDTALYHWQNIKWIRNYRAIPGLLCIFSPFAS